MKIAELKILVASALLFMTASAQALQPEVLYAFQVGSKSPWGNLVEGSDGSFYGTSYIGGANNLGTVFKVTAQRVLTSLVSFTGTNGAYPEAGLVLGDDGNFYGTTSQGGSSGVGTVFTVTTNGVLTTLVSFTSINTNGIYPRAALLLGNDGNFYSTTSGGGSGNGTVFKMTTNGVLTTLVLFAGGNGAHPQAGLALGSDRHFYGTTYYGGPNNAGTVFRVTTNGVLTMLASFTGDNGENPLAPLLLGRDGNFYGTTDRGGSGGNGGGTVFRVTTNGVLTSLVSFVGTNGASPQNGLALGGDGHLYGTTSRGGIGASDIFSGLGTVFRVSTNGVLTTLVSFAGTNGASPYSGVVLGSDGHFYGTTQGGGSIGNGTVFKMTPDGVLTTLNSLTGPNGVDPNELVLGSDANFYGTTDEGGTIGYGTVFQVTTNGVLTTLVSFDYADTHGNYPEGGLVQGKDGNFYGAIAGFANWRYPDLFAPGALFRVTPAGVLTMLVTFSGTNGLNPQAGLVLGSDGDLYGTTYRGGSSYFDPDNAGYGTIFRVTTNGVLTSLASFTGDNGAYPQAGLVSGGDGNFYGTTYSGGSDDYGTVFRVNANGVLTTLVSFNDAKGAYRKSGLVLGTGGNFYGTTSQGGSGIGTVFKITTNGVLTSLVSFTGGNGAYPQAGLVLGSDGYFYGTTSQGGSSYVNPDNAGYGTVFRVTTNGVLTTLVSFDGNNGAGPNELVLGRDGCFYGTTSSGVPGGGGTIFRLVISAFTRVARHPNGSVLLTGTGPANGSFRLWESTDLSLPFASWTLLTSAFFDSNGNFSYADVGAATKPSRFYQLSVP